MRRLVLILGLLTAAPAATQPPLVLAPPSLNAWRALFAHPEQWPQSRARTATFLFADHTPLDACPLEVGSRESV